jgi:hypothetical protein
MCTLLVTGGQQKTVRSQVTGGQDWCHYHKGLILAVDTDTAKCHRAIEYVSPPGTLSHRDEVLFKTGTVHGDRLYLCTQTEVMIYALPSLELLNRISLPCFNDLHHVRPTPDGNLLLAVSGLDMVLEMTTAGSVVREWNVLGEDPWERFSRDVDYRSVDTKPHAAHPNHVFFVGDEIWATRFHQKDAVSLTRPGRRISIDLGLPHDGVVHDGRVYFTTVNGYVVIADPRSLEILEVINLNEIHPSDVQLGWCRSIMFEDGYAWIGFSRLRSTKFRENVKWVIQGFKTALPTRIAAYELLNKRCVTEVDLEPHGLNAVYSIFSGSAVAAVEDASTCSDRNGQTMRFVADAVASASTTTVGPGLLASSD